MNGLMKIWMQKKKIKQMKRHWSPGWGVSRISMWKRVKYGITEVSWIWQLGVTADYYSSFWPIMDGKAQRIKRYIGSEDAGREL